MFKPWNSCAIWTWLKSVNVIDQCNVTSMCSVQTIWPTLKKFLIFRWVFTLFMLFSTRHQINSYENAKVTVTIKHACFNTIMSAKLLEEIWTLSMAALGCIQLPQASASYNVWKGIFDPYQLGYREWGGVVVERQTPNREVLGSIPTAVSVLCPWARHIKSLQYW